MITEDYVSFEIAKLLVEKGFEGDCSNNGYYVIKKYGTGTPWNLAIYNVGDVSFEYEKDKVICRPTAQMALKWLRDVHSLFILIKTGRRSEETSGHIFWFSIEDENMKELTDREHQYNYCADTYEQACEDAIKYCLENLV